MSLFSAASRRAEESSGDQSQRLLVVEETGYLPLSLAAVRHARRRDRV